MSLREERYKDESKFFCPNCTDSVIDLIDRIDKEEKEWREKARQELITFFCSNSELCLTINDLAATYCMGCRVINEMFGEKK